MSEATITVHYMRPVSPDEWPRFGSVWTWGEDLEAIRLMALCRGVSKWDNETVWFLDLLTGAVNKDWLWSSAKPASGAGWYCVDEGPAGAHRV